jgi:hypothetical protein
MASLSQAKTYGGIGSLLVLLSPVPSVGWILAIAGFVLTLIAVKNISDVVKDSRGVLDFVETEIVCKDPLFAGMGTRPMLLESRHEVVTSLPPEFVLIAKSSTSRVAAMKHRDLQVYGVQSHPERYSAAHPDGKRLVANFVAMLDK